MEKEIHQWHTITYQSGFLHGSHIPSDLTQSLIIYIYIYIQSKFGIDMLWYVSLMTISTSVLDIPLKCNWWRDNSSGVFGNIEYLFIATTPRATLVQIGNTCYGPIHDQIKICNPFQILNVEFHVNAHKMEYMCFNQSGNISTLNGCSLKLVDKFIYLGSSVSSTETDIYTRLAKAWTTNDSLSVIWKSDQTDKIKRSFFQAAVVSILLYGCTTWALTKQHMEEKLDSNYTRMLRAILN